MPELDFALLCQAARVPPDNLVYVIGGGWDTLVGPERATHLISVALRVLFTQGECDRPHRIEAIVQGTDGQRLAVVTGIVTPQWVSGRPAGWKVNAVTALQIAVYFPTHGEYSVELVVNDTSVKSMPLRYVPIPPPEVASGASRQPPGNFPT